MIKYEVHSLNLASTFALPELCAMTVDQSVEADAIIEVGEVPYTIPHEWASENGFLVGRNEILVSIDGAARYLIQEGKRIIIQREPGAADELVRAFLYGAAFSALLQQRRLMPLHASVVVIGERAIAFCGGTGHGKSTLAAAFAARGYAVLSDDKIVLRRSPDGLLAYPSPPVLSLNPAAARATGQALINRVSDHKKFGKHCYLVPDAYGHTPTLLTHILVTKWVEDGVFDIEPLSPFQGLIELRQNITIGTLIGPLGFEADFLQWTQDIMKYSRLFQLRRPKDFAQMDAGLDQIIACARS